MSNVNDYVRYGSNGIFRIQDIRKRTGKDGVIEDWYILRASQDGVDTSVMTPISNKLIRPILTKPELNKLLKDMPSIPSIWLEDKRQRFESFHTILESGTIYQLVQMIKSIYLKRIQKEEDGKKLSDKDKEMFTNAENLLFEEMSISYDIKKEEVMDFILSRVES